ncbi:hypothetical protein PLICRDRAFT_284601 [Plicaturopsis crispa FD-325 SS-3]|nr:hypothetical protein PLICRDRAFT_284601 [Plicaturopsis crispa FD-325 SS-3]
MATPHSPKRPSSPRPIIRPLPTSPRKAQGGSKSRRKPCPGSKRWMRPTERMKLLAPHVFLKPNNPHNRKAFVPDRKSCLTNGICVDVEGTRDVSLDSPQSAYIPPAHRQATRYNTPRPPERSKTAADIDMVISKLKTEASGLKRRGEEFFARGKAFSHRLNNLVSVLSGAVEKAQPSCAGDSGLQWLEIHHEVDQLAENFKVEFDRATGRAEDAFYLKFCQYFENREDDALEKISDADEVVREVREELQTWTYKYDVCGAAIALAFDRLDYLEARARALDTASLQTSNSKYSLAHILG